MTYFALGLVVGIVGGIARALIEARERARIARERAARRRAKEAKQRA